MAHAFLSLVTEGSDENWCLCNGCLVLNGTWLPLAGHEVRTP